MTQNMQNRVGNKTDANLSNSSFYLNMFKSNNLSFKLESDKNSSTVQPNT